MSSISFYETKMPSLLAKWLKISLLTNGCPTQMEKGQSYPPVLKQSQYHPQNFGTNEASGHV